MYASQTFATVTNTREDNSKEERFILAHGCRDFSPWSACFIAVVCGEAEHHDSKSMWQSKLA
jgi:hypothetical protein